MGKYVNLQDDGIVYCLISDELLDTDFSIYIQELEDVLPHLTKIRALVNLAQASRPFNYDERKQLSTIMKKYLNKENKQAVCGIKNPIIFVVGSAMAALGGANEINTRFFKNTSEGRKWLLSQ